MSNRACNLLADDGLDLCWTYENQFRPFPYMIIAHAARIAAEALGATRILEYGCGGSTVWLCILCPHAQITSVEHDEAWRTRTMRLWSALARAEVLLGSISLIEALGDVQSNFDLVIVDGKSDERPAMMLQGWTLLRPGGSLFLHDAQRPAYHDAINQLITQGGLYVYDDRDSPTQAALVHLLKPAV